MAIRKRGAGAKAAKSVTSASKRRTKQQRMIDMLRRPEGTGEQGNRQEPRNSQRGAGTIEKAVLRFAFSGLQLLEPRRFNEQLEKAGIRLAAMLNAALSR